MRYYARMFERGPVADLGCGRGYFLEALRDRGVESVGVDLADEAVSQCRSLGFSITQSDAAGFLAGARGLAGIFASHLIEHLAPSAVDELIARAFDSLEPGGRVVLVTPNMRDISTLREIFWLDPTHLRPYPVPLVRAMLETSGFEPDGWGRGPVGSGRRSWPGIALGRIRFGMDYGATEVWISAVKPAGNS